MDLDYYPCVQLWTILGRFVTPLAGAYMHASPLGVIRNRSPLSSAGPPRPGTLELMNDQTARKRVPQVKRACASREHVEDIDRPGHCVWCGLPFEREPAPIMPADLADIEYPGSPWGDS